MIIYNKINHPITEDIIELNNTHYIQLIDLIKLVNPEYFKAKTNTFGSYYGIFKNEKLITVTGERFQTKNFIEISAIITHPDYIGKVYTKKLVTHTANAIFNKNKIPFLHMDTNNLEPIALYK